MPPVRTLAPVPHVDDIFTFLARIFRAAQLKADSAVVMLVRPPSARPPVCSLPLSPDAHAPPPLRPDEALALNVPVVRSTFSGW